MGERGRLLLFLLLLFPLFPFIIQHGRLGASVLPRLESRSFSTPSRAQAPIHPHPAFLARRVKEQEQERRDTERDAAQNKARDPLLVPLVPLALSTSHSISRNAQSAPLFDSRRASSAVLQSSRKRQTDDERRPQPYLSLFFLETVDLGQKAAIAVVIACYASSFVVFVCRLPAALAIRT